MHPILASPRRLAVYLAAWLPLTALLVYGLTASRELTWPEAAAVGIPLGLVYAAGCLAIWYTCRVLPLAPDQWRRTLGIHLATGILEAGIWAVVAMGIALLWVKYGPFPRLSQQLWPDLPLLFGIGLLLYLLAASGYYLLLAAEASRAAEARLLQAGMLARDAELRALKAQINPHFLFNSLNSVSALTTSDPARAREMCVLLGDFLRRTLGLGERPVISLEEELSLVHAFLAVEKVRFGARLRFDEEIAAGARAATLPPLLLQPLVENALVHGVSHLIEGGWVRLHVHHEMGAVRILVENNFDPDAPSRRQHGVGLSNVRHRLAARYGTEASMAVNTDGNVFGVTLSLPGENPS